MLYYLKATINKATLILNIKTSFNFYLPLIVVILMPLIKCQL